MNYTDVFKQAGILSGTVNKIRRSPEFYKKWGAARRKLSEEHIKGIRSYFMNKAVPSTVASGRTMRPPSMINKKIF